MCRVNFSTRAVYWRLLSSGEAQVVTVSLCMRSRSSCCCALQFGNRSSFYYSRVAVHVIEDTPTDCARMSLHVHLLWDAHNLIIAEFGALFTDYMHSIMQVEAFPYAPCSTTTSSVVSVDQTRLHASVLKRWMCAIACGSRTRCHY